MASGDFLFGNKAILEISEKYKKTAAKMILRWSVQENALPTVRVVILGGYMIIKLILLFYKVGDGVN